MLCLNLGSYLILTGLQLVSAFVLIRVMRVDRLLCPREESDPRIHTNQPQAAPSENSTQIQTVHPLTKRKRQKVLEKVTAIAGVIGMLPACAVLVPVFK